ncbi:hypothetical protein BJV77DRAFT_1157272 [Russula vinacea]|nr:hypothetical protein BJV77DRAFT_1157272 [Russula vinacea]
MSSTGSADEIKAHPWFAGIEWDKLTDYFDPRGAILQLSEDDQPVPTTYNSVLLAAELSDDEFGAFAFKNPQRSMSAKEKIPTSVITSFEGELSITNPLFSAASTSIATSPSCGSVPPSTPGSIAGPICKPSS